MEFPKQQTDRFDPNRSSLVLFLNFTLYLIIFFAIYYFFQSGVGIVAYIIVLFHSAWFYGKRGGFYSALFGIVINFIMGLLVANIHLSLLATVQGIIFYPLIGFGIGYLRDTVNALKQAQSEILQLKSMLPICANCKKIRDDSGYWSNVEEYITKNLDVSFSHSLCPDCLNSLYPDLIKENNHNINSKNLE